MLAVCAISCLPALRTGGANGGRSIRAAGNVHVIGARLFQREPHEFAAALYRRPVVELVAHAVPERHPGPAQSLARMRRSSPMRSTPRIFSAVVCESSVSSGR